MFSRSVLLSVAVWAAFAGVLRIAVIPPESCGNDSPDAIRSAALAARDWMVRNQQADGTYVYLYYPETNTVPAQYNEVRHAGVTMALYQAAGRLNDRQALAAADRGLKWEIDHLDRRHGWAALTTSDYYASLGATALMAVGLAERRLATGDGQYDGLMQELGRFITALQRDDGGFNTGWVLPQDAPDTAGTSRYYPGEALWALALLQNAFPGEGWDRAARTALDYIATRRDDVEDIDFPPLADQWAAYGLGEMASRGLSDREVDYARRLAERFGFLTRVEAQRQAGWLGRLVRGHESRGAGMGTWVEGMAALWRLSATDSRLSEIEEKLWRRLQCASGILAARQVTHDEAASYGRPGIAEGAWFQGGETRMDDQQHTFSGLLYTLDALTGRTQRVPDGRLTPTP